MESNNEFDGHINRNIRLALGLIDASRASIEVVSINKSASDENLTVTWQVNGCKSLNEARVSVNGHLGENLIPPGSVGHCNYLSPDQSRFVI